jgi:uncharacterized protein YsxB (DUF464 family)
MILVSIIKQKKVYQMMKVTGHANSAPYGEDLVCAAVSAVMTGGINALDLTAAHVKNMDGLSEIQVKDNQSSKNQSVYEVLSIQLQTIAEAHPKFVKINIKEK